MRGLSDSLFLNRGLRFSRNGGAVGWIAFPFAILFEWLSPIVEMAGYVYFASACLLGTISSTFALLLLLVAFLCGTLLSVTALLLEESAFHTYPKSRDIFILLLATIIENFGYRQLNAIWRLIGIIRWFRGGEAKWGEMKRTAAWQDDSQTSVSAGILRPAADRSRGAHHSKNPRSQNLSFLILCQRV